MYVYSLTIGRNIGSEPMTKLSWGWFQHDAMEMLRSAALDAALHVEAEERSFGTGVWDGIAEDNATLSIRTPTLMDESVLNQLRKSVKTLAATFRQDAIALTIGTSELIG
jgi:hypothetical protein